MFTYTLPRELIAQRPCEIRDAARLLVVSRATGEVTHRIFRDLPEFLQPGDCLVLNDAKVIPARLFGTRADTGEKIELLLLEKESDAVYRCLGQPGKRLRAGSRLLFDHGTVQAEVLSKEGAEKVVHFKGAPLEQILPEIGEIPLPPYIRRPVEPGDEEWYQTVFAREAGAVAAPTAGLHFTETLLEAIRQRSVQIDFVTLHVGWGTFKPVGKEDLHSGRLHEERLSIPSETIQAIHETKAHGGRVVAVGTTVVRTLETVARTHRLEGVTDLFIRPPFQFKIVDALVTNFHLPGTSLLLLVSAFAEEERIKGAYEEAIRERYRFYSYGDAMLIV